MRSLLGSRLEDLVQQTGVLLTDDLVDLLQPQLSLLNVLPQGLVLELDDLLQLLIALLIQFQLQNFNIFELRGVVEG